MPSLLRPLLLRRPALPGQAKHHARPATPRRAVAAGEAQAPPAVASTSAPPTASAPPSAPQQAQPPTTTTLTLTSAAARSGLRFAEIWDGSAPSIVVTAVADELAAAGISPGARLVSLPHPTRASQGERWELTPGNAPISRVRDLIRVTRSVTLEMEFSVDPIPAEAIAAWVEAQEKAAAAKEAAGGMEEVEVEEVEAEAVPASTAPVIPDVSTAPSSYLPSPEAVAFEAEARKQAIRLAARAERNAVEDARDDTPLLVWSAVAFLGPAGAILAWAYATGLLDSLATHQY